MVHGKLRAEAGTLPPPNRLPPAEGSGVGRRDDSSNSVSQLSSAHQSCHSEQCLPCHPPSKTESRVWPAHRRVVSVAHLGPSPQRNPALNSQHPVVRMFHRVGINRKPQAASPRLLDLEETLKSSSPMCHFTEETTDLPTLDWAGR